MCIQACALNGIDHRPGGDGGAGELVKIAAIFFDRPMAVALTVDDFPGKMGDPVRQAKLDFIAQARRFMMLGHAGAEDRAAKIGSNQQLYCPGIAIWRGGLHHRADRLVVIFGYPHFMLAFAQRRGADQIAALEQIVIIAVGG